MLANDKERCSDESEPVTPSSRPLAALYQLFVSRKDGAAALRRPDQMTDFELSSELRRLGEYMDKLAAEIAVRFWEKERLTFDMAQIEERYAGGE